MDFKRFLRGPFLYIAAAVLIVVLGLSFLSGTGFREITTQEGLSLLKSQRVESAQIFDGEQRVGLIEEEDRAVIWDA